ncbi:MAG: type III-A CRISPR-associated protein Csm2 [Gemmataceae bacterium]|nr:type III-A CRISPR-associated protein Csm2 [Gemmataceae bacterium]MCI0739525.1 type III-A CRISPR-associated protein Csm2 [Gemmataceae bacterium]
MAESSDETFSDRLRRLGYFDAAGNLRSELVARDAIQKLAKQMAEDWPRDGKPTHQVRRFFQHCRAIEAKLRAKASTPELLNATWAAEEAAFRLLDVAAADAFAKSPPKIPQLFHDFIKSNVAAVKNEKDFLKGFLPHFEALVGFGAQPFRERERT